MSLPASQQHALDAIDDVLRSGDPRLARMFAVFTELTQQESMPARETLPPRRLWPRRRPGQQVPRRRRPSRVCIRLLVPVLLAATLTLLMLSVLSSPATGPRQCARAPGRAAAVQLAAAAGCSSGHSLQAAHATG
jgi:hypothetical protein